jgi:hypothetical protein
MKFRGVSSNWEFIAWYLIDPCIRNEKDRRFTRAQIMRKNYRDVYLILTALGHKKRPEHPEETLQRTLQNMRDKNWIRFFGQGEYELTVDGYKELLKNKENIQVAKSFTPEEAKMLQTLMEKLYNKGSSEQNSGKEEN